MANLKCSRCGLQAKYIAVLQKGTPRFNTGEDVKKTFDPRVK